MSNDEVTPGFIPVGDTGKNLDTTVVTTTEGDVHREAVFIADPIDPDARATVKGSKEDRAQYAALVHLDRDKNTELLCDILNELKSLNTRFEEAFRTHI